MPPFLRKTVLVTATPSQAWEAFTTPTGARGFFAPAARIDLRMGGAYEMLFDLDSPPGKQGSEGCTVLCFVPGEVFAFTWNAPPHLASCRDVHTFVVLRFAPVPGGTEVTVDHGGWGEGAEWDQVFAYFQRAWGLVLDRLAAYLAGHPMDWNAVD